jgi:drug/metabolite transporter (DMT)-like permease
VEEETRKRIALPAVLVGVLAVGASAVFIRLADAPALAIAFWRCALGALALVPLAAYNREVVPKGSALWVGAVSGVALGAHFGTWITSLEYTSVAASVVLVSTTPVFVAIAAYPLFGERTSAVSALGEPSSGGSAFFGDVLALVGAVAMADFGTFYGGEGDDIVAANYSTFFGEEGNDTVLRQFGGGFFDGGAGDLDQVVQLCGGSISSTVERFSTSGCSPGPFPGP